MRQIIHQGFREFEFLSWQDSHLLDFRDRFRALEFLRGLAGEPTAMDRLRRILANESAFSTIARLNDEEVIEQVATLLTEGRLRVLARHETIEPHWLFGTAPETEEPAEPPPSEPEAAVVAEEPPPAVDPEIVAAAENQAAILTSAAVKGSPLCEA